eukprot:CAMPEP_0178971426 /NCGR_PEP_ID=MMETSP0789-20121207/20283_1 /TAXON_ID=3005 /ORGANISM="Rhizosolenia setigera, Strain CCMP 1694" /LENGTH=123 /DNA_ID=CAMNT_0020658425 /DNA_START=265 /DNA_END=636 /DNA_ORIENTATION=-
MMMSLCISIPTIKLHQDATSTKSNFFSDAKDNENSSTSSASMNKNEKDVQVDREIFTESNIAKAPPVDVDVVDSCNNTLRPIVTRVSKNCLCKTFGDEVELILLNESTRRRRRKTGKRVFVNI